MKTNILLSVIIFITILKISNAYDSSSSSSSSESSESSKLPKNVIFIVADDLGFHDVSYRGSNEFPTYNIDALAYNGIILDRFYTPPLCTPSRSALMTGKYPFKIGMQNFMIDTDEPWGLPLNETIMPQYFKQAGYKTHMIGKWHLGFFKEAYTPSHRGIDSFFGYYGPIIDYWDYTSTVYKTNASRGYDLRSNLTTDRTPKGIYATDLFTQKAVNVIKKHNTEKPLFMIINHLAPHSGNEDKPLQAKDEDIKKFSYIKNENRRILAAMVHSLDQSVGEVISALEKRNMLKDSIIVFYSDNGGPTTLAFSTTASNYPLRGQKTSGWEGGTRTDAIIYAPFLPQGVVKRDFFYIGDFLPTILNLAGTNVKVPSPIDGIDLSNMLQNGRAPFRNEIAFIDDTFGYGSYTFKGLKIINGTFALFGGAADGWVSSNNNSNINSAKYMRGVLNSKAAQALKSVNKPLKVRNIEMLRQDATVDCGANVDNGCDLLHGGPCVFDIINDPCERKNLAKTDPTLLNIMLELFSEIKKKIVPTVRVAFHDPAADPSHFNYTWNWWRQ